MIEQQSQCNNKIQPGSLADYLTDCGKRGVLVACGECLAGKSPLDLEFTISGPKMTFDKCGHYYVYERK